MKKRVVTVGIAVAALVAFASPAAADRWCTPSQYSPDERTAAQRLPRQGVVEVRRYSNLRPDYNPRSINDDGTKGYISLNRNGEQHGMMDQEIPIVSVWESPATCSYGYRRGAWGVTPWGQVYTDGDNGGHYGDMFGKPLNKPVVGMAMTANAEGYWLFAGDGGIFTFGNARFLGSAGAAPIPAPIVAMAATPTNNGYWMAGADGAIYAYGDARSFGSMSGTRLNQPVVGMVPTPTGRGYWMVARDGGIFTFGDAAFKGSTADQRTASPIVGMVPFGTGYAIVTEDGTVYPFQ